MFPSSFLLLLFLLTWSSTTAELHTDNPCPDPSAYVCTVNSTGMNIIISAPHGGSLKPAHIPDRQHGCYDHRSRRCIWEQDCGRTDRVRCRAALSKDLYTYELALELRARLCDIMGACPAIVLNQLHRSKLDANREKPIATLGVPEVETAFDDYHAFLLAAKASICGRGLMLDIHGHSHAKQRAELGYLIYSSRLRSGSFTSSDSSIYSLAFHVSPEMTFEELLRGDSSLGSLMYSLGAAAVPSSRDLAPEPRDQYFSGGFNTKVHGSKYGGDIDAIQIEVARQQRNDEGRPEFVEALAQAVKLYMNTHYV